MANLHFFSIVIRREPALLILDTGFEQTLAAGIFSLRVRDRMSQDAKHRGVDTQRGYLLPSLPAKPVNPHKLYFLERLAHSNIRPSTSRTMPPKKTAAPAAVSKSAKEEVFNLDALETLKLP